MLKEEWFEANLVGVLAGLKILMSLMASKNNFFLLAHKSWSGIDNWVFLTMLGHSNLRN